MTLARALALALALLAAGCTVPSPSPSSTTQTSTSTSTTTSTVTMSTTTTPVVPPPHVDFSEASAYDLAVEQLTAANGTLRHRVPGTPGNDEVAALIATKLRAFGWAVSFDNFTADYRCAPTAMHNVIGERVGASGRAVILGAHYDTRPIAEADADPANRTRPIPGAIDGATGVGVLLELARTLGATRDTVRLVFFDAEDGGDIPDSCDTPWLIGSEHYAGTIPVADWSKVRAMVLVDLVGDAHMTLPRELNSDKTLQDQVYAVAGSLGYSHVFTNDTKDSARITDDHVPFAQKQMPALDLIHLVPAPAFFPEWHHTQHDDLAHVSPASLGIVGRTLQVWLESL